MRKLARIVGVSPNLCGIANGRVAGAVEVPADDVAGERDADREHHERLQHEDDRVARGREVVQRRPRYRA